MKRMSGLFTVAAILVIVCSVGCSTGNQRRMWSKPVTGEPKLMEIKGLQTKTEHEHHDSVSSPEIDPSQTQRILIYNAVMIIMVENIQSAIESVQKEAEEAGGYMQSMETAAIKVRVPADAFRKVIAALEKLGEVTQKEIEGSDVTEEMRDLQIRLQNEEEVRKRIMILLERAEKVEDALKVEKELERVTTTIELLKGKIQVLENKVAFSTLTVYFNSPLPQRVIKEEIPFPWVRELAADMTRGEFLETATQIRGTHVDCKLPLSFAKYYERNYITRATSAEGVLIKVQRHKNVEGGDLDFWTGMIRRALLAIHAITIKDERDITIVNNVDARIIEGRKEIGDKNYIYLVAVTRTRNYVVTYEAWGPEGRFEKTRQSIEASLCTMDVLNFFQNMLRRIYM